MHVFLNFQSFNCCKLPDLTYQLVLVGCDCYEGGFWEDK